MVGRRKQAVRSESKQNGMSASKLNQSKLKRKKRMSHTQSWLSLRDEPSSGALGKEEQLHNSLVKLN